LTINSNKKKKGKNMKKVIFPILIILAIAGMVCCEKEAHIDGEPASIGEEGTEVRLGSDAFSDVEVSIVACNDGVSEFAGTMTVTDERYLNIFKNHPQYFEVNDNSVRVHDVKFKFTDKGIENQTGFLDGVVVRYDAEEGDKYAGGRTVTHVSTDNDYEWFVGKIKVIEIEGESSEDGIKRIKYASNHRFGLVGFEIEFEDGTVDQMPFRLW